MSLILVLAGGLLLYFVGDALAYREILKRVDDLEKKLSGRGR